MDIFPRSVAVALFAAVGVLGNLSAQNQTADFSPVLPGSLLPYSVNLVQLDFGTADMPTLQSCASATFGRYWVLIGGRTNGLHKFQTSPIGLVNFPPDQQNREVWVIDPIMKKTWHRSLEDASSGLSIEQVDSLTTTAAEDVQVGNKLIVVGGYGFDRNYQTFLTYPKCSVIDLPTIINWVVNPHANKNAAEAILQTTNPLFSVTGGHMYQAGANRFQIIFGNDFEGGYFSPGSSQVYTEQVRSFTLVDYVSGIWAGDFNVSAPQPTYRRRDGCIVPLGAPNGGRYFGSFGGVFTEDEGAWTIPVMIYPNDFTYTFDPAWQYTFKQALNNYECATAPLYSQSRATNYTLFFGGISGAEYDPTTNVVTPDAQLPFDGAITTILTNQWNMSAQYGMSATFPVVSEGGITSNLLGAEMVFLEDANAPTLPNGLVNLDAIQQPTVIGYLFGGIIAEKPNRGQTTASSAAFAVVITPR